MAPPRTLLAALLLAASACGYDGYEGVAADAGNGSAVSLSLEGRTVPERSEAGALVGVLSSEESEEGDAIDLVLVDDAEGRFRLDGNALVVADGLRLDTEAAASHAVVVEATNATGSSARESFDISVSDILEVTTLEDEGPGSLRELLASPDVNPILFDQGLEGQLVLATPLSIQRDVDIVGNGPTRTVLSGELLEDDAIVNVGSAIVSMEELAVSNGARRGIDNQGTLSLRRVLISNNGDGGTGAGGGVQHRGVDLYLYEVDMRGNRARTGGGIDFDSSGKLRAERCLFMNNDATAGHGGAVLLRSGTAQLLNTTMTGNDASGAGSHGGAVENLAGNASVYFSTIVGNSADNRGGGLRVEFGATLELKGTVVADNLGGFGDDINGVATTLGHNFVGEQPFDGDFADGVNGDMVGRGAPSLAPMMDNGGFASSFVPLEGSILLDRVPPSDCTDYAQRSMVDDQRGAARPVGGGCDIGATER